VGLLAAGAAGGATGGAGLLAEVTAAAAAGIAAAAASPPPPPAEPQEQPIAGSQRDWRVLFRERERLVSQWATGGSPGAPLGFTPLHGHLGSVYGVCVRGELCAASSGDGTVQLHDLSLNCPRHTLRGHAGHGVLAVYLSPDCAMLASGGFDSALNLWKLPDPDGPVAAADLSDRRPDLFERHPDRSDRHPDLSDRHPGARRAPVGQAAPAADAASESQEWEGARPRLLCEMRGHDGPVVSCLGLERADHSDAYGSGHAAGSGGGRAGGGAGGGGQHAVGGGGSGRRGTGTSPAAISTLVSTAFDGTMRSWACATGQLVQSYEAHRGHASGLAHDWASGLVYTGGDDGFVRAWDLRACTRDAALRCSVL
jgi:uncharacterized membrane protein YgcG